MVWTLVLTLALTACGESKANPLFSEIALGDSKATVEKVYGIPLNNQEQENEIYSYDCDYKNVTGTIEIEFDDKQKADSIRWLYYPESEEEYNDLVESIQQDMEKKYKKPEYTDDMGGSIWYENGYNVGMYCTNVMNMSFIVDIIYQKV